MPIIFVVENTMKTLEMSLYCSFQLPYEPCGEDNSHLDRVTCLLCVY